MRAKGIRRALIVYVASGFLSSAFAASITLTEGTNMAVAARVSGPLVIDVQGTLWRLPRDGGEAIPITDIMGDARLPRLSPDGKTVAFQSYRDGTWHIWTVGIDGTDLKQVTDGVFDHREPVFSSDGAYLYFSSDREGTYDIWSVSLVSGEIWQMTSAAGNESFPTPLSDGFAYIETDNSGARVRVSENGRPRTLYYSEDDLAGLAVSPHETAFTVVETGFEVSRLVMVNQDGADAQVLSTPEEDVFPFSAGWSGSDSFFYTADGHIKEWVRGEVARIPFEASAKVAPRDYARKSYDFSSAAAQPVRGILDPRIAPDGRAIYFAALGDIWRLDRNTATPVQVTSDEAIDLSPVLSPDGATLAWVSDRAGSLDIWLRDLKSGQERHLAVPEGSASHLVWSPDGTRLAYLFVRSLFGLGNAQIQVMDVASETARDVGPLLWGPGRPSWSPDGKALVVSAIDRYSSRFREGINKFLLLPVEGGEEQFVTPHPHVSLQMRAANGPVWSPDGTQMAYAFGGGLWVVDVSRDGLPSGEPRKLLDEIADNLSWTADSQSIAAIATHQLIEVNSRTGEVTDWPLSFEWTPAAAGRLTKVRAGGVWDGLSDTSSGPKDILIADGTIVAIADVEGPCLPDVCLDVSSQTVIPGLFDFHSHMSNTFGTDLGRVWLAHGITSVREPGAEPYDALERKESWASDARPGPRLFFAGGLTDGGRVFYGVADSITSEEHLEKYMARMNALGVDMIKTYVRMPDVWQKRIVSLAHGYGLPVSSHEIFPAAAYGTDMVEHLRGTSRRGFSPKQTERKHSYSDLVEVLSGTGMTITPTMGLDGGFAMVAAGDPSIWDHPVLKAFTPEAAIAGSRRFAEASARNLDGLKRRIAPMQQAVVDIVEGGGRVTAGTDSPFIPYGLSQIVEIQLYSDGGLGPLTALKSATIWAAEAAGVADQLGTIEPGKVADFAIVDRNPLDDITALRDVTAVVKGGYYMSRESLLAK